MRTALIALNLLIATASAVLFAYTFIAREHLTKLAEEYVIRRTVQYVTPAVDSVEAALNHPAAMLAPAVVRDAVRAEVDAFRNDPTQYIRQLVARGAAVEKPKHALAERVVKWKERGQRYFEKTLTGLILDLRMFSGTNLVAALFTAWLTSRATGRWRNHLLGVSVLLLLALGFHIYLFIDSLTFFRILLGARLGWVYPLSLTFTIAYLYIRFGRFIPPTPNPSGPRKPVGVR